MTSYLAIRWKKFVQQVFVEHRLFGAEPFAEHHAWRTQNAKRNSLYSQAAGNLGRGTIWCHFVIMQRRKPESDYGAASGTSEEGAQRRKVWEHKDVSGRELGLELGLIISALIFGKGEGGKSPKLEEIVQY